MAVNFLESQETRSISMCGIDQIFMEYLRFSTSKVTLLMLETSIWYAIYLVCWISENVSDYADFM